MRYEDYTKTNYPVPYFYIIDKADKLLYYFGANHSRNPLDEQYSKLKEFWLNFVEKADPQKSIVLVEGGKRPLDNSEKSAIINNSEAGFITYLASKNSIETHSPEPSDELLFNELLENFSKNEIIYHEFAKMTYQWNMFTNDKPNYYDYINNALINIKNICKWTDFDFSLKNLVNIHENIFKNNLNENDYKFFYDITDPTIELSVINKVSRISSVLRDRHILNSIENYWNMGKNLFIVYGYTHSIMHEPAINKLV